MFEAWPWWILPESAIAGVAGASRRYQASKQPGWDLSVVVGGNGCAPCVSQHGAWPFPLTRTPDPSLSFPPRLLSRWNSFPQKILVRGSPPHRDIPELSQLWIQVARHRADGMELVK